MRIVFLGTPEFSVSILDALFSSKHEVVAVVTQPDRPKGRKLVLTPSPVKIYAQQKEILLFQPEKVSEPKFLDQLRALNLDIAVVAAFGQIFRKELLDLPRLGCWNVHASLLPKFRGALPIERSILAGEKESGPTIMKMDLGVDDGPILDQVKIPISLNKTAGELEEEIATKGAQLMVATLDKIESGQFELKAQDEKSVSHARKLKKEEAQIDWSQKAIDVHNKVRALNPNPGAYTLWKGQRLKIWQTELVEESLSGKPGEILDVSKEGASVAIQSGGLLLKKLQLPGKKVMQIDQFLAGHSLKKGELFEYVAPSL